MEQQNPSIVRPVPRRPFSLNLSSPTPPDDDISGTSTPAPSDLLNPRVSESGNVSRSQSTLNLTSSALFGIFKPLDPNDPFRDEGETDTPGGDGTQTPLRRPDLDEVTYALLRERSRALRRPKRPDAPDLSRAQVAWSLAIRTGLLFLLGMGYGALVTRLRGVHSHQFTTPAESEDALQWGYIAGWGACSVGLGALLPWFDGVWRATFGAEESGDVDEKKGEKTGGPDAGTDWSHVVRSIGAFVGIVFALRKLPWASTLQVSMALALANPFLWYLVDRTKPGFVLSVAVGLAGSLVVLGINPDMMPAPSLTSPRGTMVTMVTGIWTASVLFCSCVCFGNVGRRLALSSSAARSSS